MFNFFKKSKKPQSQPESNIEEKPQISFLAKAIGGIFSQKKLDAKTLEELEEALIQTDISFSSCQKLISGLSDKKFDKNIDEDKIRQHLKQEILKILAKSTTKLDLGGSEKKPKTLIFNGVNGSGKTTTIGKIAFNLTQDGKKVLIAACDTYRAGAADQLEVWANRSNCDILRGEKEAQDPASVACKALQKAQDENYDFL